MAGESAPEAERCLLLCAIDDVIEHGSEQAKPRPQSEPEHNCALRSAHTKA
jgi:hypothetical protein